jgi:uncharacterized membrane protein
MAVEIKTAVLDRIADEINEFAGSMAFLISNALWFLTELEVSHLHEKTDRMYEDILDRFATLERAITGRPSIPTRS